MKLGDLVVATKYSDGDPKDHFCVGYYDGLTSPHYTVPRHNVKNDEGQLFRQNGFRKVEKINQQVADKIISNIKQIENGDKSIWWWVRKFKKEKS